MARPRGISPAANLLSCLVSTRAAWGHAGRQVLAQPGTETPTGFRDGFLELSELEDEASGFWNQGPLTPQEPGAQAARCGAGKGPARLSRERTPPSGPRLGLRGGTGVRRAPCGCPLALNSKGQTKTNKQQCRHVMLGGRAGPHGVTVGTEPREHGLLGVSPEHGSRGLRLGAPGSRGGNTQTLPAHLGGGRPDAEGLHVFWGS